MRGFRTLNKYGNQKIKAFNQVFDSKLELEAFLIYQSDLGPDQRIERQVPFVLQEAFINVAGKQRQAISWIADFVIYKDDKILRVIDAKCQATKTEAYKIKKKLFEKKYGVAVEEFMRSKGERKYAKRRSGF